MTPAQLIIRKRYQRFKQESQTLFQILIAVALLASPLLVIFLPLPGYLIYSQPLLSIGFGVGSLLCTFVALLNYLAHQLLLSEADRRWLKYLYGGELPFKLKIGSLVQQNLLIAALFFSPFFRIEHIEALSLTNYLLCFGLLCLASYFASLRLLNLVRKLKKASQFKLIVLLLKGSWGELSGLMFIATTSLILAINIEELSTQLYFATPLIALFAWLCRAIHRKTRLRFEENRLFLASLKPAFPDLLPKRVSLQLQLSLATLCCIWLI